MATEYTILSSMGSQLMRNYGYEDFEAFSNLTWDDYKRFAADASKKYSEVLGKEVTPAMVLGEFTAYHSARAPEETKSVITDVISSGAEAGDLSADYAQTLTTFLSQSGLSGKFSVTPISSLGDPLQVAEEAPTLDDPILNDDDPPLPPPPPPAAPPLPTIEPDDPMNADNLNLTGLDDPIDDNFGDNAESMTLENGDTLTEVNAADVDAFRQYVQSIGEMDFTGAWKYTEDAADGSYKAGDIINPADYLGDAALSTFFDDGGFSSINIGEVEVDTTIDTSELGNVDIDTTDTFTDKTDSAEGDFTLTADTDLTPDGTFTDIENPADITYTEDFLDYDPNAAWDTTLGRVEDLQGLAQKSINPFQDSIEEVAALRSEDAAKAEAQRFNLEGALGSGAATTAIGRAAALPAAEAVAAISQEYSRVFSSLFSQTLSEAEAAQKFKVDANIQEQTILLNDIMSQRVTQGQYNDTVSQQEIAALNAEVAKWSELGANERAQLAADMELAGIISAEERAALDADIREEELNSMERMKAIDAKIASMGADVDIAIANQLAEIEAANILNTQELATLEASLAEARETNDWAKFVGQYDIERRKAITDGNITKAQLLGQFMAVIGDPTYVVSESNAMEGVTAFATVLDAFMPDNFSIV